MNEVGNFNIAYTKTPTNKNINVVFSPSNNVKYYSYEIYKNNIKINTSNNFNQKTAINLNETGVYQIKINALLNDETTKKTTSGFYIIDKEAPEIEVKNEVLEINKNEISKISENVQAKDNFDGNLSNQVKFDTTGLKSNKIQKLTYTVVDRAGNETSKQISVKLITQTPYTYIMPCLFAIAIIILTALIVKIQKALKIEKRIEPYTLKPVNNNKLSISEKAINKYQQILKTINKSFEKSEIAKKYAKSLNKYIPVSKLHTSGMDIFSGKLIMAFILVIIAIILQAIRFKFLAGYEITLIFTFGFFVLDILYFIKYKIFRWQVESDFIAAITIMNNAFKSGKSITQAIDIVSNEITGTVGEEFKRMSLELLYGLELEVVFKRFAKRIDLEEANYLTASLTILNKTGGDIIKVFDSIERNMFDKRKLRLELASLTSGSKIVVSVLLGMPFFFVLVINLINHEYFIPFLTTNIGVILLIIMIIYYIIFVVVVRKIMKVVI
ncbi:MAG: type II secretion system F family protein [Bacilli bacterium]|nr:type II secretion system F family protein [Bacilli bacterium]